MHSEERSTLGGHGSDAHLMRVHWRVQEVLMEDTTTRSAPGGYRGRAGLPGTEDTAGVSTISLNPDDVAGAEDTGWMPRQRIVSTLSLNHDEGMSAADVAW